MRRFELTKVWKRETFFAESQRHMDNEFSAKKHQKFAISKSQKYNLLEAKRTFGLTPIGGLARLLMSGILGRKNKTRAIPWQETIAKVQEAKRAHNQLKSEEKKWRDYALKRMPKKSTIGPHKKYYEKTLPKISSADEKSYGTKVDKLQRKIAQLVNDGIKVGMRLEELQAKSNNSMEHKNLNKFDDEQSEEAQKDEEIEENDYGRGENEGYGKSGERTKMGGEAARTKAATAGQLMDILSPRFMSVTPRKSRGKANFLSPSLFSLHTKGRGLERKLSVPNLIKEGTHLADRDQNEWLNLIMEASGVNEQVDTVKHLLSSAEGQGNEAMAHKVEKRYKREFDGLYLTKENVREMYGQKEQRKSDTWEKLVQNLTMEQWTEMNRTGVVSMNVQQLRMVYGPSSPFSDSEALRRLLPIVENSSCSVSKMIESDIHRLSEMGSFDIRQNDVLSPSVFKPSIKRPRSGNPLVLSPLVFSPTILSPTIMGPAILSPRFFSPPILSPRIMTPLVLSPFIFSSIILTPIIMQPFILSPGFLNSIILSPFIMNPQIMSSHFFHPAILSPLVLTPAVLNPTMMSPIVLSPLVLTPQIFSPKFLSGLFLSPYALSPVFMSPVFAYLVILSPSWLS